jgi:hypothetical protein
MYDMQSRLISSISEIRREKRSPLCVPCVLERSGREIDLSCHLRLLFPLCTRCFSLSVGVDDVLQYLYLIDLKRLVGKPGSSEFIGTSD